MSNKDIEYLKKYLPKSKLKEGLKKLEEGYPVQYIVGEVDFYGNIIKVNKDVLIPRFETELLVEKTINYINKYFNRQVSILDIGTGSGCIAITLSKITNSKVTAIDISDKALEVAKNNAKLNDTNITFVKSNIFTNVKDTYDIIISNPPYIRYDEEIMDIVKNNEPSIALYADNNGLYFYEQILKECSKYLNKKYLIAFEIGAYQAKDIISLANTYLKNINICVEKDYSGLDRFIFIYNLQKKP